MSRPRRGSPQGDGRRSSRTPQASTGRRAPTEHRRAARPDTPARRSATPAPTTVEVTYLAGLADVLRDEVVERLAPARPPAPVPGREDALAFRHTGPLVDVLRLRTAVAAYVSLHFDVPRPRSLTSGDHLARIVDAVYASLRAGGSSSFRFEAAGSDSSVFQRLAGLVHDATGLQHDPQDGQLVLRVRRGARRAGTDVDPGWDVLVRIGPRPLSARTWRVADYPGAVNATIAAAMVRLVGTRDDERVLNLMCGSGTLVVERLLAGPAAEATGVDLAPEAVEAARANLDAAGLARRAQVQVGDAFTLDVPADGPYDVVLADPPWGGLHGSHASAAEVHSGLLDAAHRLTRPGGTVVVLTHEITVMQRCLRDAAERWDVRAELKVFAKGHHPRVFVLDRR